MSFIDTAEKIARDCGCILTIAPTAPSFPTAEPRYNLIHEASGKILNGNMTEATAYMQAIQGVFANCATFEDNQ